MGRTRAVEGKEVGGFLAYFRLLVLILLLLFCRVFCIIMRWFNGVVLGVRVVIFSRDREMIAAALCGGFGRANTHGGFNLLALSNTIWI